MIQKMQLTLEIDDSALDAAQAKADKLIATVNELNNGLNTLCPTLREAYDLIARTTSHIEDGSGSGAKLERTEILCKLLAKQASPLDNRTYKIWNEAFEKGLVRIPPPEQPQAKEKPPEGGNSCKCEDMTERLDIAREIAQAMFKAPD